MRWPSRRELLLWLTPTRRGVRIAAAFLLTPFVLVMMLFASWAPEGLEQNAVLVLAVLGFVLIVSAVAVPHEASGTYAALKQRVGSNRTITALLLVILVAVGAAVFEYWLRERVPGKSWAGLAVQAGLALWLFGVVVYLSRRLVSRGRRGVSALVSAFAGVVLIGAPIFLLREVYDGPVGLKRAFVFLVALPATVFVILAARRVVRRRGSTQPAPPPPAALAIIGVFCAIVSGVLLLGSAIRVPIERRLLETSQVAERGAVLPVFPLQKPGAVTDDERAAVLARYAPVLRLHEHEQWIAYDAKAALGEVRPSPREDCEKGSEHPCDEAALERISGTLPDRSPPKGDRVFDYGVLYPRLHSFDPADIDDEIPGFARKMRWLAQYWIFYPHNRWQADTAIGWFVQDHGGDWEWVGVGLDVRAAPLFVAYSAHCAGSWRPWSEAASVATIGKRKSGGGEGIRVLVGGTPTAPASHPLVIVALGSHANYATTGTREPDWAGCKEWGRFWVQAVKWLTFAVAAREETPDLGSFQVPEVQPESDTEVEAQRRLWWGSEGREDLWRIRLGTGEHGPPSPMYQEGWRDPLHTIFGTDWECDAGDACRKAEAR